MACQLIRTCKTPLTTFPWAGVRLLSWNWKWKIFYGFSPTLKWTRKNTLSCKISNQTYTFSSIQIESIPTCVRSLMRFEVWTFRINFIASNGIASMNFACCCCYRGRIIRYSIVLIFIWTDRRWLAHLRHRWPNRIACLSIPCDARQFDQRFRQRTCPSVTILWFVHIWWVLPMWMMFRKWDASCCQAGPSTLWNGFRSNEIVLPSCDSFFLRPIIRMMSPVWWWWWPFEQCTAIAAILCELKISIDTWIRTWPNRWT